MSCNSQFIDTKHVKTSKLPKQSLRFPVYTFLNFITVFGDRAFIFSCDALEMRKRCVDLNPRCQVVEKIFYYIPITDTTFELSAFWLSDTESRINELRFSDSVSLSLKKRLTSVTCFCGDVT